MDFTSNESTGYSNTDYNSRQFENTTLINVDTLDSLSVSSTKNIDQKMSIAQSNTDLVDKCLSTKSDKYLSKGELKNYGMVALRTAALDVDDAQDFRVFALKRIEFMMNRAIAEAHLILESKKENSDNNSIIKQFKAIQNIYSY